MQARSRFKNMNFFGRAGGLSRSRLNKQILVFLLSLALLFATRSQDVSARRAAQPQAQAAQAPRIYNGWNVGPGHAARS
jgi:hypothetical protein